MAITNFVPQIWSAAIQSTLTENLVAAGLVNTNYQGDIATKGDTVNITTVVDPTIGDYSGSNITVEDIDDGTLALVIDQAKYFAFELDDVDAAQAVSGGALLAEATSRAAFGLAKANDTFLFGEMHSDGTALDIATTVTAANEVYGLLVDMSVALDENDVPDQGRWVVVTPEIHGLLLQDDRFVAAGDAQGAAVRSAGSVGSAAGLSVYKSNNLPDGTAPGSKGVVFGSNIATTFAQQISKVVAFEQELKFNQAVKGLHLYGAKVVRPEAVGNNEILVDTCVVRKVQLIQRRGSATPAPVYGNDIKGRHDHKQIRDNLPRRCGCH